MRTAERRSITLEIDGTESSQPQRHTPFDTEEKAV
jgi:hypothetical protein